MTNDDRLAELLAEVERLNDLMATDCRERTEANYRRRDSLRHKLDRWRREGVPRTNRYDYRSVAATDIRNNGGADVEVPTTTGPGSRCVVCGDVIPEYRAGRKVRADARTDKDACRQALYRARRDVRSLDVI